MFDAVLGKGKEYFGFSNPSEVNAPPIWLPYNVLDRLLLELNAHSEDPLYGKVKIKNYLFPFNWDFY